MDDLGGVVAHERKHIGVQPALHECHPPVGRRVLRKQRAQHEHLVAQLSVSLRATRDERALMESRERGHAIGSAEPVSRELGRALDQIPHELHAHCKQRRAERQPQWVEKTAHVRGLHDRKCAVARARDGA